MTKPRGKQPPWTAEDDAKLRHLVRAGWTDGQIARELGREAKQVQRRRYALDIESSFTKAHSMMVARLHLRRRLSRAKAA